MLFFPFFSEENYVCVESLLLHMLTDVYIPCPITGYFLRRIGDVLISK